MKEQSTPLVEVRDLCMWFPVKRSIVDSLSRKPKRYVKAVNNVSLTVEQGESLGLVGESGCGKSTLAKSIIRLYEPTHGNILLKGDDITHLKGKTLREKRSAMQMIFQDPYSSLNPRMTIYEAVAEVLSVHHVVPKDQIREEVERLLGLCGLGMEVADRYPGEFSGGQRQRVGIARALAVSPDIVLADEPVSALDVSIRAQIINLLSHLQKELNLTILFISHDLHLVHYITKRVAVMYLGKIVEIGPTSSVFSNPMHPYTSILIQAAPVLNPLDRERSSTIKGEPPSPLDLPKGCAFGQRCPYCTEECTMKEPVLQNAGGGQYVACHHPLHKEEVK
ncbi:MAG: oligopeptide/dipeptide ABC transporter ATP-binding protein [Sphaerochaetaceae bacterium]|jgi:oligopeptide/dipeptide ABC transporter ATP-binding protein